MRAGAKKLIAAILAAMMAVSPEEIKICINGRTKIQMMTEITRQNRMERRTETRMPRRTRSVFPAP